MAEPRRRLAKFAGSEFVRFLAVGVLNTAFGYGCFALLLWLGLHYAIALLIATIVGVLFNFKTIGTLVFRAGFRFSRILKFTLVYLICYAVNVAGVRALLSVGLNGYMAGAILILPVAVLSFILNKQFVFRHA